MKEAEPESLPAVILSFRCRILRRVPDHSIARLPFVPITEVRNRDYIEEG